MDLEPVNVFMSVLDAGLLAIPVTLCVTYIAIALVLRASSREFSKDASDEDSIISHKRVVAVGVIVASVLVMQLIFG